MEKTYKIIRFYRDSPRPRVIHRGFSLEDAQAYCQMESTHGDGWFDGYDEE